MSGRQRWTAILFVWSVCAFVLVVLYAQNFVARLSEVTLLLLTAIVVGGAAAGTFALRDRPGEGASGSAAPSEKRGG